LALSASFGALKLWHERKLAPETALFFCWSLFCVLFFSASKSKLPGYILPAVPAIGILLAHCLVGLIPFFTKYLRWLLVLFGWVFVVAGVLLYLFLGHLHTSPPTAMASRDVTLILLFFALANWLMAAYKTKLDRRIPAAACCVLPVLLLAGYVPKLLPAIFPYDPSGKTLAAEIMSTQLSHDMYVGPIPRGQYFSLNFYLHREMKEWDKSNPTEGYLLLRSKLCRLEVNPPWTCSIDPIELPKSGWFVYKVERSELAGGFGGRAGGNLGGGQPR
jgi:4-amino-4-deoxy-L-arabinose transferase-like glycosyltransferase